MELQNDLCHPRCTYSFIRALRIPSNLSRIADSGIVNVDVGTECKRYYWHQDLIKKESPFIAAEIDRWFQENPENENAPTILVPKGQAECFQIINKWLYNTSSIQVRLPKLDIRFHCRLYEAATDLELERLQNDVVDYLRTNGQLANLNTKTTVSLLLHFQENRPNSPICELLVAALATRVDHQPQSYTNFAKAHPEQIAKLFANPKLAEKLIWSICAREDPYDRTPFAHSMEVINCMFHKHDNSSECTAYKTFAD